MINIQDIIPFMKKGWVAMNASGDWWWFSKEPHQMYSYWWNSESYIDTFDAFDIAPADDWIQSLIKVGGNDETMA